MAEGSGIVLSLCAWRKRGQGTATRYDIPPIARTEICHDFPLTPKGWKPHIDTKQAGRLTGRRIGQYYPRAGS